MPLPFEQTREGRNRLMLVRVQAWFDSHGMESSPRTLLHLHGCQ